MSQGFDLESFSLFPTYLAWKKGNKKHKKKGVSNDHLHSFPVPSGHVNSPEQKLRVNSVSRVELKMSWKS